MTADPLTPSYIDKDADRLIGNNQRAYIWHGLWGGFIVHQLYTYHTSYNDPELIRVALQRAKIGAQLARRFLPILVSFGGIDEAGLGYGIIPDGKFAGSAASTFPDIFQRAAYETETGTKLPPDPRKMPDAEFVKWFRWRAGIMQRFFTEAKRHVKRVDARLPWGQDVYASMFANDGVHPFTHRMNDLPTTHTFMFWFGPPEMHWNFALERTARRDKRFHFCANTTTWGNNKPDEASLAAMCANYTVMEGIGMLWYLSMNSHTNMAVTYPRLHKYGDFINATLPDIAPVGVLFSFNEIAMRCKEAGDVPSDAYYSIANDHGYPIGATFRALRRAGYFADYVHEEEIPEGGLKGRKVVWLVGIRHRLAPDVLAGLEQFVQQGGRICCDATTDVKTSGLDEKSVTRTTVDYSSMNQWRMETQNHAAKLLEEKKAAEYAAATREMSQSKMEAFVDRHLPAVIDAMKGVASEVERSERGVIWGKWVAGDARYYCLINDVQAPPSEPDFVPDFIEALKNTKVFRACYWAEAKDVKVKFHNLKKNEAVYVIEGRDWSKMSRLGETLDFAPTEMKIVCVLPAPIKKLTAEAKGTTLSARIHLRVAVPLEVVITDGAGQERYRLHRSTNAAGEYQETFPVAGKTRAQITELFTGKKAELEWDAPAPGQPLRPAIDVQVFDETAIRALLKSGQRIVVVLGDKASAEEKAIAQQLASKLKLEGKDETTVLRKGRYPKVFAAIREVDGKWKDVTIEQREKERKEWDKLGNWVGNPEYPPSLPDAYEADDHLILIGTDKSSTLIQAIQRASMLMRVANDYYPGKGHGFVQYAWSPFAFEKDVILITGSDADGLRKAAEKLLGLR